MSLEKTSLQASRPLKKQPAQEHKPKRTRKRAPVFIATFLACALLIYGSINVYHWWQTTHGKTPVSTSDDVSEPAETPLSIHDPEPFPYAPKDAKSISIPAINVSGYIQKVGIRKNNSMGVPSNIHVAGWYTKSVLPGEKGLSVIDGHVHGNYNAGIFENLGKVKKDDRIIITFGDNSQKTFSVISTTALPLEKANERFLKHDPKIPQELHLITCTGEYSDKLKTYNERVLVVATLVE